MYFFFRKGYIGIERGLLFHSFVLWVFGDTLKQNDGQQFPRFFIWLNLKIMPTPEGLKSIGMDTDNNEIAYRKLGDLLEYFMVPAGFGVQLTE